MPKFNDDELPKINNGDEMSSVSSEGQEFASATQSPKAESPKAAEIRGESAPSTSFTSVNSPKQVNNKQSLAQNGKPPRDDASDEAQLRQLLSIVSPEVARAALLPNWRKCMTGNTGCEIYYISELVQNATHSTLTRAMSNPRTQREIIEALSSKAKHEVIDKFFKEAAPQELMPAIDSLPHRVKHEIIDRFIRDAPAQELLTMLAHADRLGFSVDDIIDENESVIPNSQGLPPEDGRYRPNGTSNHQKQPEAPQYQYSPYPVQHQQFPPPSQQSQVVQPQSQYGTPVSRQVSTPVQQQPPPPPPSQPPPHQPVQDPVGTPGHAESPQPSQDGIIRPKARLGGSCPECGRSFTQKHSMQTHTEQQVCFKKSKEMDPSRPYDPSRTKYTCPGCDFRFAHPHAQEYHITNNHCGNVLNPDGTTRLPPKAPGPPPSRTTGFQPINGVSRSEESKKRLHSALAESRSYAPASSPVPASMNTPNVRSHQADPRNGQHTWTVTSRPSPVRSTPQQGSPMPTPVNGRSDEKSYDHLTPEQNRAINVDFDASQKILDDDIRTLSPNLSPGEREVAVRRAKGRCYARNNAIRRQYNVPIQENRKKDRSSTGSTAVVTPGSQPGKRRRGRPSRYDVAAYQAQATPVPPAQIVRAPVPSMTPGSGQHQLPGIQRPDWLGYSNSATPPAQNSRQPEATQPPMPPQIKRPSFSSATARPPSRSSEGAQKRQRTDDTHTPQTHARSEASTTSSEKPRVPIDAAQRKWEAIQGSGSGARSGYFGLENVGAGEPTPSQTRGLSERRGSLNRAPQEGESRKKAQEAVYISSDENGSANDEDEEIPAIRPTSNSGSRGLLPQKSLTPPRRMMARRGGGNFSPRGSNSRRGFGGKV